MNVTVESVVASIQRETLEATQWVTQFHDELRDSIQHFESTGSIDPEDPAETWERTVRSVALRYRDAKRSFAYVHPPYMAVVEIVENGRRRGVVNPFDPSKTEWLTAELMLAQIGIIFDRQHWVMKAGRVKTITGDEAATMVAAIANANIGSLAPIREDVKVDGRKKIGYGLIVHEAPPASPYASWSRWADDWPRQRGETA